MTRKAFPLRLDPQLHEKLDFFSNATGASMNRLVVDAVESYLQSLAAQLDSDLTETLRQVRAYARSEAATDHDLEAVVEGELCQPDPAEGTVVKAPKATV